MFTVYFRRRVQGCITPQLRVKDFNGCYLCIAKKCTYYGDKMVRVEVDEKGLDKIRSDKFVDIVKIIQKESKKNGD